ncbi:hypothetical protein DLJ82_6282 (plasmid) [Rhizobium leguminosarum]|uniref:Uncharacterized protein n=1 Tax=Rhizobium leguminosarum TaxID=384 RepID=A0A2Z4YVW3_RHILE|nr:hypothetical protein DLJ82_6282 [Rhizobium leguminosarum]
MRGRTIKLSASRRLVGDLMRFSIRVPRVTVQRQMNIRPLLDARDGPDSRPVERFANAANGMTLEELQLCIIQAEAIVAAKTRR